MIEDKNSSCENQAIEFQNIKDIILKELRHSEKRVIDLTILGYSDLEISKIMSVSPKWVSDIKKDIASRSNIRRIAKKCGYIGGN